MNVQKSRLAVALLMAAAQWSTQAESAAMVLKGQRATVTPDWMLSFQKIADDKYVNVCAGTMIAHNIVLTAARTYNTWFQPCTLTHSFRPDCILNNKQLNNFLVRGKKYFDADPHPGMCFISLLRALSLTFRTGIIMTPKDYVIHERFDSTKTSASPGQPATYHDDVALLRVAGGESIQSYVKLDDGQLSKEGSAQKLIG